MSFASHVRAELCRAPVQRLCCARAECYGILLYCNTFHVDEVRIITESGDLAGRLPRLSSGPSASALTACRSRTRPAS